MPPITSEKRPFLVIGLFYFSSDASFIFCVTPVTTHAFARKQGVFSFFDPQGAVIAAKPTPKSSDRGNVLNPAYGRHCSPLWAAFGAVYNPDAFSCFFSTLPITRLNRLLLFRKFYSEMPNFDPLGLSVSFSVHPLFLRILRSKIMKVPQGFMAAFSSAEGFPVRAAFALLRWIFAAKQSFVS